MASYFAKVAAFSGLVAITCLVVILTKLSLHGGKFLYNPASAIAMAEFFKFSMSVYFHHTSTDQPAESKWSLSSFSPKTLTGYCCLGLIYCINNQLTFFLVTVADPASITLAKSTTPFFTAVFLWVLLNREINKLQWCCILCQMLGLIIVQYDPCLARGVLDNSAYFWLTVALSLTSLSSVVNESLLKGSPVPLNMQNVVLYGFGVCFNVLAFFVSPVSPKGVGFFDGYDFIALSVVFMNSIIGIVITFIYKHLDAIVKNFASSVASAFLIYISAAYFGLKLTLIMVCGTGVLMVTMYIYFAIAPLVATALKEQAAQAASSSPNSASVSIAVAEDAKPKAPNVFVSRQKSAAMAAALLAVFVLVFVWQLTFSTTRVYVYAVSTSPHQHN